MSKTATLDELRTELVVQPFADRILVLVTQMGKVGTLIQASIPPTTELPGVGPQDPLPVPPPAIQLTPIFGSAPSAHMHALYSLYAAQIATLVWLTARGAARSVVVGIALERTEMRTDGELGEEEQHAFRAVMQALRAMLQSM